MRKRARIVSSYHNVQGSKLGDHTVSTISAQRLKNDPNGVHPQQKMKNEDLKAREIMPTNKVRFMKSFNVTWAMYETQN